ncbi:MAG: hypothetical protein ACTHOF_03975 [Flavisolibacter sp.]
MKKEIKIIRWLLCFFITSLFLSGLTAIPIDAELSFLLRFFSLESNMHLWLSRVLVAYRETNTAHPFLLYGYDWLAFAHFILAILFIGPYRDPVKNIWVIQFGLIACVLIFPLAFIAGSFRGIPLGWRLIDCSFGIIGVIPLWICYRKTQLLTIFQSTK